MAYLLEAARRYFAAGFSLIPCWYKRPAVKSWEAYQIERPSLYEINRWFSATSDDLSIGLILGAISHNVVAIDLDGIDAMKLFQVNFPHLTDTRIVLSGSGSGAHLYYRVKNMPANVNVRAKGGGFEIRGTGQYVIAPPSPHKSGGFYKVYRDASIKQVDNLNDVWQWFESMRDIQERWRKGEIGNVGAQAIVVKAEARKQKILKLILSDTLGQVQSASEGYRNVSLYYAGLRLANYAAGGDFQWQDCEAQLLAAAVSVGLSEPEARRTIASAWRSGSKNPKKVK